MCPAVRAHWRHLANTIELVLPSAHQSPQPKRQIDRFGRFCTALGRKSKYFTVGASFPNIASIHGIWTPSNTWFCRPTRVLNPNGISIDSAVFLQCDRQTDRARYKVGNYGPHIYVPYVVLRCGPNNNATTYEGCNVSESV